MRIQKKTARFLGARASYLQNDRQSVDFQQGDFEMNTTTRTLIAIPLAAAALSAGATAAMAQPAGPIVSDLEIAQPEPQPEPHPQPGPQLPGDKIGPAGDPGPQDGPDDKDGPNNDPDPDPQDGPDDKLGPNPGDDDDDDGDNDDGDNDDGDNDDNDVKRPTRVDAGGSDGLSLAWLLGSGAMVTAAGGFTARRVALNRR
jgi:hypothetical protein